MARAATTTDAFNAIGDRIRRAVLGELAGGELSVGELAERLDCVQPAMSRHLKVLRDVDLVRDRRVGRTRLYRVHRAGLEPVQSWLSDLTAAVNENYDRLDDYLQELQASNRSTED